MKAAFSGGIAWHDMAQDQEDDEAVLA